MARTLGNVMAGMSGEFSVRIFRWTGFFSRRSVAIIYLFLHSFIMKYGDQSGKGIVEPERSDPEMPKRMGFILVVVCLIVCRSVWAAFEYCVDTSGPWHWVHPFPMGHSLFDAWIAPNGDLFAVGAKGTILRYDGVQWTIISSPTSEYLRSIWGTSDSDVYAVGEKGVMLHFDGVSWSVVDTGVEGNFNVVWGSSSSDVYAAGWGSSILHYDGSTWSTILLGKTYNFESIWGSGSDDVYFLDYDAGILHFDGLYWDIVWSEERTNFSAIWGTCSTDVYAFCKTSSQEFVLHFDGVRWEKTVFGQGERVLDAWGTSSCNIFAVGDRGTIHHFDGLSWQHFQTAEQLTLSGVIGSDSGDVIAVGEYGQILRLDETGWENINEGLPISFQDIWSSADDRVFAVGNDLYSAYIYFFDGRTWKILWEGVTGTVLCSIWGESETDVFAVGQKGSESLILHFDGNTWTPMLHGYYGRLTSLWGTSSTDLYSAGRKILHYDGNEWSVSVEETEGIEDIWGSASDDVYAIENIWYYYIDPSGHTAYYAQGYVYHFDGTDWEVTTLSKGIESQSIWGSSRDDIYISGVKDHYNDLTIQHFNGHHWEDEDLSIDAYQSAIHGISKNDIYLIGSQWNDITTMHFNGQEWTEIPNMISGTIWSVWCQSPDSVFAAGGHGSIIHYPTCLYPEPPEPLTGVVLSMPSRRFSAGDVCALTAAVTNASNVDLTGYPLVVMLDAFGSFFFGPDFDEEFGTYLEVYPVFPPGETIIEVIPEFIWPDLDESASGLAWYSVILTPEMNGFVGNMGTWAFGWNFM